MSIDLTVEGNVSAFLDAGEATLDAVELAMIWVGRNNSPALVADLFSEGLLTPEVAAVVVPDAWSDAEFPQRCLDEDYWRALFDLAGYTEDGKQAVLPQADIRLYRGASRPGRFGWSWTDNQAMAERFATKLMRGREPGMVWTALVEPWRLFCRITDGRHEDEYVIDTAGLIVSLADS